MKKHSNFIRDKDDNVNDNSSIYNYLQEEQ